MEEDSSSSSGPEIERESSSSADCAHHTSNRGLVSFVWKKGREERKEEAETHLLRRRQSPLLPRRHRTLLRRHRTPLDEIGMVRVDVRCLNRDQALNVLGRRTESFAEEFGDDFDQLGVETRVALEFLSF